MKNIDMTTLISKAAVYVETENVIWLVTAYGAFLVKLNLTTKKFEEHYEIPYIENKRNTIAPCISICRYEDELIMAPNNMEGKIILFNLKNHTFDFIEMPLTESEKEINSKIGRMCVSGKCVYLIGLKLHAIFLLDMEKRNCEKIYTVNGDGVFSYGSGEVYGNKLYVPMSLESKLLVMDLENKQVETIQLDTDEGVGFTAMIKEDEGIVLATRDSICISYDANYKKKKSLKTSDILIEKIFLDTNKKLWCFEINTEKVLCADTDGVVEQINYEYSYLIDYFRGFSFILATSNHIIFQLWVNGNIYSVDKETKTITRINIEANDDLRRIIIKKRMEIEILHETSDTAMEDFLDIVMGRI